MGCIVQLLLYNNRLLFPQHQIFVALFNTTFVCSHNLICCPRAFCSRPALTYFWNVGQFSYAALILCFLWLGCNRPTPTHRERVRNEPKQASREQHIAGNVEKRWVLKPEKDSKAKSANDVRFIFYRNYNITTFGPRGSRQGHWSFDDEYELSFHFEGLDSVERFVVLALDSATLQLQTSEGASLDYKPE
jgi:hypothetical protein